MACLRPKVDDLTQSTVRPVGLGARTERTLLQLPLYLRSHTQYCGATKSEAHAKQQAEKLNAENSAAKTSALGSSCRPTGPTEALAAVGDQPQWAGPAADRDPNRANYDFDLKLGLARRLLTNPPWRAPV